MHGGPSLVEAALLEVGEELVVVDLAGHPEEALAPVVPVPKVITVKRNMYTQLPINYKGHVIRVTC